MEAETVLNLLDSYWYNQNFFKKIPTTKNPPQKTSQKPTQNPEIPTLPTIHTKSPKSEKLTPKHDKLSPNAQKIDTFSPNSVLFTPKLEPIFSGKVSQEFGDSNPKKEFQETPTIPKTSPLKGINGIRRKKKGLSKSLSDLEFEELKGFMDLGFVFSEEDNKDSNLVSIIPGLQRFGKTLVANDDDDDDDGEDAVVVDVDGEKMFDKSAISRPYLSEAWAVLEKKRRENSLLNWKVPAANSEIDMKDYLRSWAHNVAKASSVR